MGRRLVRIAAISIAAVALGCEASENDRPETAGVEAVSGGTPPPAAPPPTTAPPAPGEPVWTSIRIADAAEEGLIGGFVPDGGGGLWAFAAQPAQLFHTPRLGEAWTAHRAPQDEGFASLAWFDASRRGALVGQSGRTWTTVDGGAAWKEGARLWSGASVRGAAWDGERGTAVGDGGRIAVTDDGGASWRVSTAPTQETLYGAAARGASRWAVGENGAALFSADGGGAWSAVPVGVRSALFAVRMGADGRGFACGGDGTLVATENDGATWAPEPSGVGSTLYALARDAGGTWWAAGLENVVLRRRDRGAWERVRTPEARHAWTALHAGREGFVTGGYGGAVAFRRE